MTIHGATITKVKRLYLFATNHCISLADTLDEQNKIKALKLTSISKAKSVAWERVTKNELVFIIDHAITVAINKFEIAWLNRRTVLAGKNRRIFEIIKILKKEKILMTPEASKKSFQRWKKNKLFFGEREDK